MEPRDHRIERLYLEGLSLRTLAKAYKISHERVRQILLRRGVALRTSKARQLDGALRSLKTPIQA